jgi:vacuolar-type H+-ATPase subunit E/Vma4
MTALKAERVMPALQPVRAEILRRAAADAEQLIADARDEATRIIEQAREMERQITETARAAGESAAALIVAEQGAALERSLRHELLAAQDNAYQQWRRRGTQAVLRLRDEPDYSRWRDLLRGNASAVLGADAQVKDDPGGGIVAQLGHRRVDLSLSAIAQRALDRIAPEVDGLWS